jgi:hypothetical protein
LHHTVTICISAFCHIDLSIQSVRPPCECFQIGVLRQIDRVSGAASKSNLIRKGPAYALAEMQGRSPRTKPAGQARPMKVYSVRGSMMKQHRGQDWYPLLLTSSCSLGILVYALTHAFLKIGTMLLGQNKDGVHLIHSCRMRWHHWKCYRYNLVPFLY